jgi:hypothetical protein
MNIPEKFSEDGYGSAWEDKFAELIVRECMSITEKCSTGPGLYDLFADKIIAEYFGVEV